MEASSQHERGAGPPGELSPRKTPRSYSCPSSKTHPSSGPDRSPRAQESSARGGTGRSGSHSAPLGAMFTAAYTRADAIANLSVACLSLIGGLGIVLGFIFTDQRHLRRQLILGLGVTDCVIALNILAGNAEALAGHQLTGSGCSASGFFYQGATVTSSAWALCIALVTYATLCHPTSRFTACLEKRTAILYFVAFALVCGLTPAIVGTIVFDQVDIGGVCWYTAGSLEGKLMLFVPRSFTFCCVIAIYIRLITFFASRDTKMLDSTIGTASDENHPSSRPDASAFYNTSRHSSLVPHLPSNSGSRRPSHIDVLGSMDAQATTSSATPSPTTFDFPTHVRDAGIAPSTFVSPFASSGQHLETIYSAIPQDAGPPGSHTQDGSSQGAASSAKVASEKQRPSPRRKPLSSRALNRRLSLLMALYPLAYLVLFSVSVARLADSLANPDKFQDKRLIMAARLMVYLQGFVDGLIFFLIEYLFRRSIRRRGGGG